MQRHSFNNPQDSFKNILNADIRSASRLLTLIEQRSPAAIPVLKALYPHTGKAKLIGVTGPAGVGKSTLINALITVFRRENRSIGILSVDPSSPISGGAILGDRLRMHKHFLDRDVFIRSLSSQGTWGGISPALFDAIHVLDAMGKEVIFIETIGVGQDEVRIAQLAETLLLVLTPGMGDVVQTMKSGLLEVGDLIVVNKSDLFEDDQFIQQLHEISQQRPVIKVSAEKGVGFKALILELEKRFKSTNTRRTEKERFVREELKWLLFEKLQAGKRWMPFTDDLVTQVVLREKDPYALIETCAKAG